MDKGVKHPSSRQAAVSNEWEPVEPDPEQLTQERVQQQQLQIHIGYHDQYKYKRAQNENTDSLEKSDDEDETEDLPVYDSLEVLPIAKRNVNLLRTEYLDTHINQREETSELCSNDSYSELRYDPHWRTNLKRNGSFNENPQIYIEEYYPEEESRQSCADGQELETNGGYRYVVDTSPGAVLTPCMAVSESNQPYHLHPKDTQTISVASPNCHQQTLQLRSPHADVATPSSFSTENGRVSNSPRRFREQCENGCDNADNISMSPEVTQDLLVLEFQTDLRRTQRGPSQTQKMNTSTLTSPKVLRNRKLERLTKDIVEHNKITLGRNMSKCGSYVRVHTFRQEKPHNVSKVHESLQAVSTESQDSSDPELRWLQKTQQLRVTQKGKKAQRKEYFDSSQQQKAPAPRVGTERRERLNPPLARPAAVTQPKPQNMTSGVTSSQTLPTTIHLNINLNTSSHLLSLLQQKGQDTLINLASLLDHPHWSHTSKVQLALSQGNQLADSGKPFPMSPERLNAQLYEQNLETSPEHGQKTNTLKLLLSDGDDQNWSPSDIHTNQIPQNFPRTLTASSQGLGSYPVLPPIGKPTEKERQLCPDECMNTGRPIHRSSSDSYLSQMEKKKQLKERVTYKMYSLKDYKQVKPDTNLRGLGPDYTAIEKTKMKRQKLYSNVICEQNKKISRIPLLLAKDPEGSDKKVPRTKALEYAKTIAKPPQPKQRHKQQPEGITEHSTYLQDLDTSQLATLELLRKRHEEEKQAVAHFRKVHAV